MFFKQGDLVQVIALAPGGFQIGTIGRIEDRCGCVTAHIAMLIGRSILYAVSADTTSKCLPHWALKKIDGDDDSRQVTTWDQVPFFHQIIKRREKESA